MKKGCLLLTLLLGFAFLNWKCGSSTSEKINPDTLTDFEKYIWIDSSKAHYLVNESLFMYDSIFSHAPDSITMNLIRQLADNNQDTIDFGNFKLIHPSMVIKGHLYHLVEGDILLDSSEYFTYVIEIGKRLTAKIDIDTMQSFVYGTKSTIDYNYKTNSYDVWPKNTVLSYCISKSSFANDQQYQEVKKSFCDAVKEWEMVCGIKFKYLDKNDLNTHTLPETGLDFVVEGYDSKGEFIANSFFPHSSAYRRTVLIDPSFFSVLSSKTGIMLHEIGHILGFRHEHIENKPTTFCQAEVIGNAVRLYNIYDRKSAMHYFCNGCDTCSFRLSDIDKKAANALYPLSK